MMDGPSVDELLDFWKGKSMHVYGEDNVQSQMYIAVQKHCLPMSPR